MLASRLRQSGEEVTLVGLDRTRIAEMKQRDLVVIEGSPADADVLERAGAATAMTLIAASSRDDINKAACCLARDRFQVPQRIALISDLETASTLVDAGTRVVQPQMATALALEGALLFPAAFDMLTNNADGVEMRDVPLSNPRLAGRPMRRVQLPGDALVVGLRRDGDVLVPHGNTILRLGDQMMLVGHPDDLHLAMDWLNPIPA